jgi:UDP-glucose 4-epimerase
MAQVWITGARGFIGRHLAAWLSRQGHKVAGLGHGLWPKREAEQWGIQRWLNGDVHSGNLQQLLREGGAPDVIFHLAGGSSVGAAIANPHEDFTRTVASTAALLDWMRLEAASARLVAISSAAVYGAGHARPIDEGQMHQPFSPYGYHKLMMESLCQSYAMSYGIVVVVMRLFSVYGSGLKKQLLWDICTRLASGVRELELGGTGEELRDWTDIRDVVRVLELAMDVVSKSSGVSVVNAGTGQATSVRGIAMQLVECWPDPVCITFNGKSRPGDPFSLVADDRVLKAMDFKWIIPVNRGISDYVKWYMEYSRSRV